MHDLTDDDLDRLMPEQFLPRSHGGDTWADELIDPTLAGFARREGEVGSRLRGLLLAEETLRTSLDFDVIAEQSERRRRVCWYIVSFQRGEVDERSVTDAIAALQRLYLDGHNR